MKELLTLAAFSISLNAAANVDAGLIQPSSIAANVGSVFNNPSVLINAALGSGGVNYAAPNPVSGGSGTSWYTSAEGTTPVTLTFDFGASQTLGELYLWDYYKHTPTNWTLKFFSGSGGAGTELLDLDFTISPLGSQASTKHVVDFTDVAGALSGTLTSGNASAFGGVGLAEIGFTPAQDAVVPEPSTFAIWSLLGGIGLVLGHRRHRRNAAWKR